MACDLSTIDWTAPWLAPWRDVGEPMARNVAQGATVYQACNEGMAAWHQAQVANGHDTSPACHVEFVPQADLPEGHAYEQFIFDTQTVPTRDGLHDFFNALCWLHFPLAKKQLNAVQAAAIAAQGVGAVRGPVRDAVTVFDENATLIQVPDVLWNALRLRDWVSAFVTHRDAWHGAQVQIFGHAALEKLVNPYKAIAVHLWRVPSELARAEWDAWLAHDLQPSKLAQKPFVPTPVLGIPGWWPANAAPAFYQDSAVFRTPRAP